jgi:Tol biopolymer transport system component
MSRLPVPDAGSNLTHGPMLCNAEPTLCAIRSSVRRLTHEGGGLATVTGSVVWSPEEKQIAFVRATFGPFEGDEHVDAFVLDANGQDEHKLGQVGGAEAPLAWLPKHARMLVVEGGSGRIYIVYSDGRGKRYLRAQGFDGNPVPSPDGKTVVFERFGPVPENGATQPRALVVATLPYRAASRAASSSYSDGTPR